MSKGVGPTDTWERSPNMGQYTAEFTEGERDITTLLLLLLLLPLSEWEAA